MMDGDVAYLLPEEAVLKDKTPEQIVDYCMHCGKCCMFWENGQCIHYCTSLIVEEENS
jgi:hypothetical protein